MISKFSFQKPHLATFKELEEVISKIKSDRDHRDLKALIERIEQEPMSVKSITHKITDGWVIKLTHENIAITDFYFKKVILGCGFYGYERDKTLFHELVHIVYPKTSDGNALAGNSDDKRRIIAEYFGRRFRAVPELLRSAIKSFGLSEEIYDLASFEAFGFPFGKPKKGEFIIPFKESLMD